MNQITVQGQICNFLSESYISNTNIQGGLLTQPVTLEVGDHTLSFISLYTCTETEMIYGGFLSHIHLLEIGAAKNRIPALSAFFYFGSEEIESLRLATDTEVMVGPNKYTFASCESEELLFHPNGEVMRGNLKQPTPIEILGIHIESLTVGFWEDNTVSGVVPFHNTWLQGYEFKGGDGNFNQSHYSISLNQDGALDWGLLSNGNKVFFP